MSTAPGTPQYRHPSCNRTSNGTYNGQNYARYQYKVTDGGRIWFFVDPAQNGAKIAGRVLLERCEPGHPKETE